MHDDYYDYNNRANPRYAFHRQIYKKIIEGKEDLKYEFETLEHEVRHVILDEQEHITELSLLLGE